MSTTLVISCYIFPPNLDNPLTRQARYIKSVVSEAGYKRQMIKKIQSQLYA